MITPKVRFAPSPTGYLHIGGLRTALINYIYAKKNNGIMVLRIEDTDKERSKPEYEEAIVNALKWAGISWDEFYRQSERLDRYEYYFKKVIDDRKAYYCFCNVEEEVECECSKLDFNEAEKRVVSGEKHAIKLKKSVKDIIVKDEIKGNIEFKSDTFKDFVIKKSDGMPVFHFAVVVDDFEMGINLVMRGEDHLSNTPRHMMIYDAIGAEYPKYAHLPLMLGEDKTRLSKRHGVVSIDNFKETGMIKEGIINYLTVLGFSMEDENEFFTLEERIESFSLEKISNKATVFSYDKLTWYSKAYMGKLEIDDLFARFSEYLKVHSIEVNISEDKLRGILSISKDKVATFKDMYEYINFFFVEPIGYDEKGEKKFLDGENNLALVKELYDVINKSRWNIEDITESFRRYSENKGIGLNKSVQPIRLLITGKLVSPGLFESMYYLGKEETMKRIENYFERIKRQV